MEDPPKADNLCRSCQVIDMPAIIGNIRNHTNSPKLVRHLGSDFPSELLTSSCPMCRIVIWMLQVIPAGFARNKLVLATVRPTYNRFDYWREKTWVFTLTTKRGLVILHSDDLPEHRYAAVLELSRFPDAGLDVNSTYLRPCPINSHQIDYERIQRWLSCCNDRHRSSCKPPLNAFKPDKVVDCISQSVVLTPLVCEYIALSYVWGRSNRNHHDTSISDLQNLPATIQDAITVVLKLGYRYLWIDRYCIEQTDSLARHLQIQQMGNIYNGASITIIAAAGSSSYHGLPGVSQIPRTTQTRETISGSVVVGFPDHPRKSLHNSVWNTRAWTYQEALLSRRRLIFWDEQLYFECQECCREESYVDNESDEFAKGVPIFHKTRFGRRPEEVFRFISSYSRKHLTFETDYLNAFLGILGVLGKQQHPVQHLAGVPIFPPVTYNHATGALEEVAGSRSNRFMIGMTWAVTSGRRRSVMFPSWSWVGWTGEVGWTRKLYCEKSPAGLSGPYCHLIDLTCSCQVWIEEVSGELVSLEHPQADPGRSVEGFGIYRTIQIESTTFPVTLAYIHNVRPNVHSMTLLDEQHITEIPKGDCITWKTESGLIVHCPGLLFDDLSTDPAREIFLRAEEFKALVIGTWVNDPWRQSEEHTEAKILRRREGGYEVVGHISFQTSTLIFELNQDTSIVPEKLTRESLLPKFTKEQVRLH